MPEDLNKKIEQGVVRKEQPLSDDSSYFADKELIDAGFEQKENFSNDLNEGKKALEKKGEGFSAGKAPIKKLSNEEKEREEKIEEILSEGLDDVFLGLPLKKQEEFKVEGEKAVAKINTLLNKAKINVEKIISIIKSWLSIIPKVNRFFLEQEAKIKTDKIIKLKK